METILKHPTKAQVQVVIDNFKKVLPKAKVLESSLSNRSVYVLEVIINPTCRTPMCHAGWYLVSKGVKQWRYNFGAELMSKDLGFNNATELRNWAGENPSIWGNHNGELMFRSSSSFADVEPVTSLSTIIAHWEGVRDRLPE